MTPGFFDLLANAGTPLILSGALHLLVGNLFIGFFEGWCLHYWFRFPKMAMAVMIAANYATAWVAVGIASVLEPPVEITLRYFLPWIAAATLAAWALTVIVEWPFAAFSLRPGNRLLRRSFVPNLVVQSVSYILMFVWYALASDISLVTKTRIASAAELSLPASVAVFFVGPDGAVYQITGDGAEPARVDTEVDGKWDRLQLLHCEDNPRAATLSAIPKDEWNTTVRLAEVPVAAIPTKKPESATYGMPFHFGRAESLDPDSDWNVSTGFWPVEGLDAENRRTKAHLHLALESPVAMWYLRGAVLLPDEQVLFQVGDNEIYLLHLPTRKLRCLAKGHGATAAILPD